MRNSSRFATVAFCAVAISLLSSASFASFEQPHSTGAHSASMSIAPLTGLDGTSLRITDSAPAASNQPNPQVNDTQAPRSTRTVTASTVTAQS